MRTAGANSPSQRPAPESSPPFTLNPKPQRGRLERFVTILFIGPAGGMRAGWRLATFLVIVIALIAGMSFMARALGHATPSRSSLESRSALENEVVAFLIVLFASWVMSRIERRKIADYGLPLRRAFRSQFWQGIVLGFVAITALLVGLRLAGVFRFGNTGLHGSELWEYGVLWGLVFLFGGLFEEFFFRGYSLFTLTTGMTFWPSAILLSAFFGLIHHNNPDENWLGALEAGTTGLLFCFMLRRTGDLWMAIGFHAAWNWGETYFYGVPNSGYAAEGHLLNPTFSGPNWMTGGSAGPEGSWLCIALLVIFWIISALWLREKKYPNPGAIRAPQCARSVEARS